MRYTSAVGRSPTILATYSLYRHAVVMGLESEKHSRVSVTTASTGISSLAEMHLLDSNTE